MTATAPVHTPAAEAGFKATLRLVPFMLIVLLGYGSLGLPLAALPVQIHDQLGYGSLVIGFAITLQSVTTLLTRPWAGSVCDRRGGKPAVLLGAAFCAGSGLLYLSSTLTASPAAALLLLLAGRVLAGPGESLMITGSLAWSIAALGGHHAGRAMVWIGIAMYGAIAAGGPAGLWLGHAQGFGAIGLGTLLLPLLAAVLASPLAGMQNPAGIRLPFLRVLALIWRQGSGLALASIGFGAISAFVALDFQSKGWSGAGLTLAAFGSAYILARLLGGHLPDRGGVKVARVCLIVEIVGMAILWLAPLPSLAIAGAFLAGGGFSLVFPYFGIEAVKRVPAASRGAALGGYVAFFDIGLALTGPVTGLVVAQFGFASAFATGAVGALLALAITLRRNPA